MVTHFQALAPNADAEVALRISVRVRAVGEEVEQRCNRRQEICRYGAVGGVERPGRGMGQEQKASPNGVLVAERTREVHTHLSMVFQKATHIQKKEEVKIEEKKSYAERRVTEPTLNQHQNDVD